jgi:hypothetical protein
LWGGKQPSHVVSQWLTTLQIEVGAWIGLGKELGYDFFKMYTTSLVVTQKLLMLTLHRSKWGTCILQTWIPNFNPNRSTGLKVPTWITLKGVRG